MKTYLISPGMDIWQVVGSGYQNQETQIDEASKKMYESNSKAINAIFCGLASLQFINVMQFEIDKEMQDKHVNSYEGDSKVKNVKLQTYKI